MGKFDNLKESLTKSTEKMKEAAVDAGNKIKETDYKELAQKTQESIKSTAGNIQSSIKNFDAETAKDDIANMTKKGADSIKQYFENAKETDKKVKSVLSESEKTNAKVLPEDAIKIIYLLMLSDRAVSEDEKERFESIIPELDTEGCCNKNEIVDSCNALTVHSNEKDYIDYIIDQIQEALYHSKTSGKGVIDKKLLLWDLLAVAYSDGEYSENEKEVLRTINRRMEIDPSIILEMETAVSTIDSLCKQEEELKQSSRPFAEIDSNLKEIDFRKNVIMQSVYELIDD